MTDESAELICPKCKSPMRTYARNGITIDQCTACYGIFLDRGELERLITAESSYLGGVPGARGEPDGSAGHRGDRGFLGELFD
jgi:Zn-finger nucleic acid-binding protein